MAEQRGGAKLAGEPRTRGPAVRGDAHDQIDLAWMGPFGYVLANTEAGAKAIATAKYDDKPIYHAIVVSRPDLDIERWPEDGNGLPRRVADP